MLTSTQLAEWEAYYTIEPVEERKQDYRMAYLASLISNIAIRALGKKGAKLTKVDDFLIEWDVRKPKEQQSQQTMKDILMAIASSQNQKVTDEKNLRKTPPKALQK